jgi:hypothetical protein
MNLPLSILALHSMLLSDMSCFEIRACLVMARLAVPQARVKKMGSMEKSP